MKKNLSIAFTSALFICALAAIACEEKKDPVETMMTGFMTGHTDSEGYITVLNDDFGRQYMVKEKSDKLVPDTLYRIVASVALDENYSAKFVQMAQTLSYIAPEDSIVPDTMRVKDPIQIVSAYIGGGYLNVYVDIKVKKEGTEHTFFYTHLNTPGKPAFTFYHNAYGDEPVYTKHAYVSIPLYGYGLARNDTVSLSCKSYEGDYDMNLIYK